MMIKRLQAGIYAANCYIIHSEDGYSVVVDPAGDVSDIMAYIGDNNLKVEAIILTHGHGDHIGGVVELRNKLKVPVMVHADDEDMLKDGNLNLSSSMAMGDVSFEPDRLLQDGDIVTIGKKELKIIHTPGHTKGGISLLVEDILVTGDTLFQGSIGRTDLYGGDFDTLMDSIINKLMVLPDETKIYPGHGAHSSIGAEKMKNPFIKGRLE
ncbi:MAG: MBL fold metallo-hydrolase [Bacillota bacterium]